MKRILAFVGDIYEDLELWYPVFRLREEGWEVVVAGPEAGKEYTGKNGYPCVSDTAIDDMQEKDFDALLVPGGFMPDKLRRDPKVLELVQQFNEANKPISHICHGGWILISADVLRGRKATSTPGIKDDMSNAGAEWVDQEVVIDGNQLSSRRPDDLPAFSKAFVDMISKG